MFAYLSRIAFHMAFKNEINRLCEYIFIFTITITEKAYKNKLFGIRLRLGVVR